MYIISNTWRHFFKLQVLSIRKKLLKWRSSTCRWSDFTNKTDNQDSLNCNAIIAPCSGRISWNFKQYFRSCIDLKMISDFFSSLNRKCVWSKGMRYMYITCSLFCYESVFWLYLSSVITFCDKIKIKCTVTTNCCSSLFNSEVGK